MDHDANGTYLSRDERVRLLGLLQELRYDAGSKDQVFEEVHKLLRPTLQQSSDTKTVGPAHRRVF